jgi:hypothetical protein
MCSLRAKAAAAGTAAAAAAAAAAGEARSPASSAHKIESARELRTKRIDSLDPPMRMQAEFLADEHHVETCEGGSSLKRCRIDDAEDVEGESGRKACTKQTVRLKCISLSEKAKKLVEVTSEG